MNQTSRIALNSETDLDLTGRKNWLYAWYTQGFSDALGDRLLLYDSTDANTLELLRLHQHLTTSSRFEEKLRARAQVLRDFHDAAFAPVYAVERLTDSGGALAVISAHVPGQRLSELLSASSSDRPEMSVDVALSIVKHLAAAVGGLNRYAPGLAHGALGPERVVITPQGRVIVIEHVLGAALAELDDDRDHLWRRFRLATLDMPRSDRFGPRTDVLQIGLVALALILRRNLEAAEFPSGTADLVRAAEQPLACWTGGSPVAVVNWLERALQLDPARSFASAHEAATHLLEWTEARPKRLTAFWSPAAADARLAQTPVRADPAADVTGAGVAGHGIAEAPLIPIASAPASSVWASDNGLPATSGLWREQTGIPPAPVRPRQWTRLATAAVVFQAVILLELFYIATLLREGKPAMLVVQTTPAGATVRIDGQASGITPVRLAVDPGAHAIEISNDAVTRRLEIAARRNTELFHYFDLGAGPTAAVGTGGPPPAPSAPQKPAPEDQDQTHRNRANRLSGTLRVSAPLPLQLFKAGRYMGTTGRNAVKLPVGRYEIELENRDTNFRTVRAVEITPERPATLSVDVPNGLLELHAEPSTEVWIDALRIGSTPMGKISRPIGRHQVVFRHPQLGEQSHEAIVKAGVLTRLSMDLRR